MEYASLLCVEFGNSISDSKMTTEVSNAQFWSLILHVVYTQEGISLTIDNDVVTFP